MEEPSFGVVLTRVGDRRTDVVQVIRRVTGLSAWRGAGLAEGAPEPVVERTCWEAAAGLRAAGAEAAVRCDRCARTVSPGPLPVDGEPCASVSAESCPAADPDR